MTEWAVFVAKESKGDAQGRTESVSHSVLCTMRVHEAAHLR